MLHNIKNTTTVIWLKYKIKVKEALNLGAF